MTIIVQSGKAIQLSILFHIEAWKIYSATRFTPYSMRPRFGLRDKEIMD